MHIAHHGWDENAEWISTNRSVRGEKLFRFPSIPSGSPHTMHWLGMGGWLATTWSDLNQENVRVLEYGTMLLLRVISRTICLHTSTCLFIVQFDRIRVASDWTSKGLKISTFLYCFGAPNACLFRHQRYDSSNICIFLQYPPSHFLTFFVSSLFLSCHQAFDFPPAVSCMRKAYVSL